MTERLLSVVTGTYNRRESLAKFMNSVRRQIPVGLAYNFIICDGGSTDGTLEWLREQPDVDLIEHGALLGAIKAFTDAADKSTARYTLMGNDDVELIDGSILRAIVHLETHPGCGGVGFAHNLPTKGRYEVWDGFRVEYMRAIDTHGEPTQVVYAQIGLFRTELGHQVGWWGGHDPIMANGAGTYGADNYISAKLWELGYSIDTVVGVGNIDKLTPDELRNHNYAQERANPGAFWKAFPKGPRLGEPVDYDVQERMRVLYLPIYEPGHGAQKVNKRGLREALAQHFLVYEHDYVNDRTPLERLVEIWQPHLMLMQLQGAQTITPDMVARAREAKPDMVVVNWNGDVHERGLIEPSVLQLLRHVDLQLTINTSVLPVYERAGITAAYWQIGYEPVPKRLPAAPKYDVLFLGNLYSDKRRELGDLLHGLEDTLGIKVGIYGHGWQYGKGETLYKFDESAALVKNAKIVIGDNQWGAGAHGFVSNRLFETLANGGFLLHQRVDGLEELTGIKDGVHLVFWDTLDELPEAIAYWLSPAHATERKRIAKEGRAFVRDHHSFEVRVRELFEIIRDKVAVMA